MTARGQFLGLGGRSNIAQKELQTGWREARENSHKDAMKVGKAKHDIARWSKREDDVVESNKGARQERLVGGKRKASSSISESVAELGSTDAPPASKKIGSLRGEIPAVATLSPVTRGQRYALIATLRFKVSQPQHPTVGNFLCESG